jgi:hypothetical protein
VYNSVSVKTSLGKICEGLTKKDGEEFDEKTYIAACSTLGTGGLGVP